MTCVYVLTRDSGIHVLDDSLGDPNTLFIFFLSVCRYDPIPTGHAVHELFLALAKPSRPPQKSSNHQHHTSTMSNNIHGGGRSRNMMSSVDFYRRVPKDLTEVRYSLHVTTCRHHHHSSNQHPIWTKSIQPPLGCLHWPVVCTTCALENAHRQQTRNAFFATKSILEYYMIVQKYCIGHFLQQQQQLQQ